MGLWDIPAKGENIQARPHFSKFKNKRCLAISKLEERWGRINFFSTKHTFILSETALDEYSFIILEILGISVYGMVFFNENTHNGSGFILGANEYSEPDLTNEALQSLSCPAVFAAAGQD